MRVLNTGSELLFTATKMRQLVCIFKNFQMYYLFFKKQKQKQKNNPETEGQITLSILFIFRERGSKREREGEKHHCKRKISNSCLSFVP